MKRTALILVSALFLVACQGSKTTPATNNNNSAQKPPAHAGQTAPQLAEGHNKPAGPPTAPQSGNNANSATANAEESAKVPPALQEKVSKAEAKAKAANASASDKKAAAAAFIERGNIFYNAGDPKLYRYALRDFRIAARLDPANEEAAGKRDQIIQIYQSLGKPAPTLGEEQ